MLYPPHQQKVLLVFILFIVFQGGLFVEGGKLRFIGLTTATQRGVNADWAAKTGHNFTEKLVLPSDIYAEVEQDLRLDVGQFDIYQYPKLPARYASEGLLRDLSQDVQEDRFQWSGISLSARKSLTEYDGKIWTIPIDTDSQLLYYRRDLIGSAPRTWEDYLEVVEKFHNTDINGDGEKDYGACTNSMIDFSHLAFLVASSVMKFKKGQRQGYLFDVDDDDTIPMKTLLQTKGWEYVMSIVKQIAAHAEGEATPLPTSYDNFKRGRCATYISFPSAGSMSAAEGSYIHDRLGVSRVPGSHLVFDREKDALVTCNTELCPFMEANGVNQPSYLAGGIVLMINAKSPNMAEALDYAAYATVNVDVRLPGGINLFRDAHFNATWFEEKGWNGFDAAQYVTANKLMLTSPHTTVAPQTPNFFIIYTNVVRALHEMLGFAPYNKSSQAELPAIPQVLADLEKRITEETVAEGLTDFKIENYHRRAADLPPLVRPTDPLVVISSDSNSNAGVYIGVFGAVVILLIMTTTGLLWQTFLRRPPGIDNAPLDPYAPFGVVIISTEASTSILRDCAERSSCFLLQQVGGSMIFVGKDILNITALLVELDEQHLKTLHAGVHFGKGTIVKPHRRTEEPRYGGRVVETAQELHAIACCLTEVHGILTVGEVQSMVLESSSNTNTSAAPSPFDPPTQQGKHRRQGHDAEATQHEIIMSEITFKSAGDKKFRGGIVRRICSISRGSIRHPPVSDIHNACLALAETENYDSDEDTSKDSKGEDPEGSFRYSNRISKTVYRRGSVVHVDCTRARTAVDLMRFHEKFKSWAEHFGGDVETVTAMNAIATFGVHKANTLHEQNACRCALKLQEVIQSTICITSGSMRSTAFNDSCVASGMPLCTATLMSNHTSAMAGPSRIFVQHDVIFATAMPSLPHDILKFMDNRGDKQTCFVVHELFSPENFPFGNDHATSKVRLFKECFDLIRSGKYLKAAEKVQPIEGDAPQCVRLCKMIQFLLETEGENGNGYSRRIVGIIRDHVVEDTLNTAQGSMSFLQSSANNNHSSSDSGFFNLAGGMSINASEGSGTSATGHNEDSSPKKETTKERSRRTREEVEQALKARTQTTTLDDGLISMFTSDYVDDNKGDKSGEELLELPTTVTDVTGVNWTRSEKQISAGAYAVVYRGISAVGRVVSLKCFDMEGSRVQITPEEIASEVSTLSSYVHENIIGYITYGFVGRYCFIVMEHAAGGSLHSIVKDFGVLCHTTVKTYVREALLGLQYLHSQQIVHCDIKPHNILIGSDGICKIADFGSTTGFADPSAASATFESMNDERPVIARGTAPYMAPEVCRGEDGLPASDMWSLGITIIELMTGKHPWGKIGGVNHFIAKLGADDTMVPSIPNAVLGEEIGDLVRVLLQRNPSTRPTATEALAFPLFL